MKGEVKETALPWSPTPSETVWNSEQLVGDRLIVTPHAAWSSPESVADARRLAVETAMLYLRDGKLRNLVNAPHGKVRAA